MNLIISAVVGGLVASAVTIGGIQAYQGGDPKPVSQDKLVEYASE
ncbi:hypothetical protein ACFQ0K_00725 [Nocardioides caeni]|nr:hypothetical protein [Nocardioides caeni]